MDQNINNSRQDDDVLNALTSSQGKSVQEKKISKQSNEPQNYSSFNQNYVDMPALSPGETPRAQGTTKTEENSSSFRQSYLDQNINNSRQNDDALIALTSIQGKPVKKILD